MGSMMNTIERNLRKQFDVNTSLTRIPACSRRPQHRCYRSCHHRQFPRRRCSRLQDVLHQLYYYRPVEHTRLKQKTMR